MILAILVLNGLVGFAQAYRAERAMAALKALAAPSVRVRRGGQVRVLPATGLVQGLGVVRACLVGGSRHGSPRAWRRGLRGGGHHCHPQVQLLAMMDYTSHGVLRAHGDCTIAAALCRAHGDTPTEPVHAQDDNVALRAEVGTLPLLFATSIACCLKVDGEASGAEGSSAEPKMSSSGRAAQPCRLGSIDPVRHSLLRL